MIGWLDDDQPREKISPDILKDRLEQERQEILQRVQKTAEWIAGFNAG